MPIFDEESVVSTRHFAYRRQPEIVGDAGDGCSEIAGSHGDHARVLKAVAVAVTLKFTPALNHSHHRDPRIVGWPSLLGNGGMKVVQRRKTAVAARDGTHFSGVAGRL